MMNARVRYSLMVSVGLSVVLSAIGCKWGHSAPSDAWRDDVETDTQPWPLFENEPVELAPTSQDLILDAYEKGEITQEQFYLFSVQAAFLPSDLLEKYRGAALSETEHYDVSPLLNAVAEQLDTFSPAVQETLRPFVLPPTDPLSVWHSDSYVSLDALLEEAQDSDSTTGEMPPPAYPRVLNKHPSGQEYYIEMEEASDMQTALTVRSALSEAGVKYKAAGFPEPTDWVLVFLKTSPVDNLGAPIDGLAFRAEVDSDGVKRCNLWIKKNQDEKGLKATAAHELFHCVQFHYPLRPFPTDAWLYESTAVWAEEFVYPLGNTEHEYDPGIFSTFNREMFDIRFNRHYGSYLWWFFLYQNAGKNAGPIRQALIDATSPGTQQRALERRANFKQEHKEYAFWNLNSEPFVYYQDHDNMPTLVPMPPGLVQETVKRDFEYPRDLDMEPGGINYYAYKIDSDIDKLKVRLDEVNNKIFPDIGIQMIYKIDDHWLYLDVSAEDEIVFCRRRPSERVTRVILVFNNPDLNDMLLGGSFGLNGTEECAPRWSGYTYLQWSDGKTVPNLPTISGDPAVGVWADSGQITMRDTLVYDREYDQFLIKETFYNYASSDWQTISYSRPCGLTYESDKSQLHGGGSKTWKIDGRHPWFSDAPTRFVSADEGKGIYKLDMGPPVGVFYSRSESLTERRLCPGEGISTPAAPEQTFDVFQDTYNSEKDGYVPVADPNTYDVRAVLSEDGKRLTGVGEANFLYGGVETPVRIEIDYSRN
ncbi:MAG: hypothetical protein MUC50_20820 [Myxococcota bacterium]|jgi:hypothetical protein|nr:hypothetical protein [Myxococcota bacterium]